MSAEPPGTAAPRAAPTEASGLPGMPLAWRMAILAIVVTQFLFAHGAVWKRRFDWDRSILYSYATIPVLVVAALLVRKRLSWTTWFAHTVEIASIKFAITASILLALLVLGRNDAPPMPEAPVVEVPHARPVAAVRPPTVIDPAHTGIISGRVADAAGQPITGAIAFVASGLDAFVFPVPEAAIDLQNDGTRFQPPSFAARTGQIIQARSSNGQLHTLILEAQAGSWVRNIPLLASGQGARLPSADMHGVFSMRCAVHGSAEGKAHLALFEHPFFAIVGADGAFRFQGVPEGDVTVGAFLPERAGQPVPVKVVAGREASATVTLLGR